MAGEVQVGTQFEAHSQEVLMVRQLPVSLLLLPATHTKPLVYSVPVNKFKNFQGIGLLECQSVFQEKIFWVSNMCFKIKRYSFFCEYEFCNLVLFVIPARYLNLRVESSEFGCIE